MRTSISTEASAATTLVRVPPRMTPGLTEIPCCRLLNFEMAMIWRASSRMALCPLPGSRPACAATPFTLSVYSPTPLRAVFDGAANSGGGFEHEYRGGVAGQCFGDFARGIAADFFVGNQQDGDGPRQVRLPGLQGVDGVEHQRDSGFHVEHARAVQAAVGDVAGHGGERAERIDGVEVAEEQNGIFSLPIRFGAGKSTCRLLPNSVAGWKLARPPKASKLPRERRPCGRRRACCRWEIRSRRIRGWCLTIVFLSSFEIAEAVVPAGILFGHVFFRPFA